MLNYEVEPSLLSRYVPPGTVLDSFQGRTYVSLVGFRFCHTKLLGCFPVPFHANFDEINLRFYVRGKEGDNRRGVVFIAEVVPMRAIAATARIVYGENYTYFPMRRRIETEGVSRTSGGCIEYHVSHAPWQVWATVNAGFEGDASALYGGELANVLQRRPDCAFVADGSSVIVFRGSRVR